MKSCLSLLLLLQISLNCCSQTNRLFVVQEKIRVPKAEFNNKRINNVSLVSGETLFFFSDSAIFKSDLKCRNISMIKLKTCIPFVAFQVYYNEETQLYYFLNEKSSAYITCSQDEFENSEACQEVTVFDNKSKGRWTGIIPRKNIIKITNEGIVLLAAGGLPHPDKSNEKKLKFYQEENIFRVFDKNKCVKSFGFYDPVYSKKTGLSWSRIFFATYSKSRNEYLLGFSVSEKIYRYDDNYEYKGEFGTSITEWVMPIPQITSNAELQLLGFKPEIETLNYRDIIEDTSKNLLLREVFKPEVDTTNLDIDWVRLLVSADNEGKVCLQPNPSLKQQGDILLDKNLVLQVYDLSTYEFIENLETSLKYKSKFLGLDSLGRYLYFNFTKDAIEIDFCTLENEDEKTKD